MSAPSGLPVADCPRARSSMRIVIAGGGTGGHTSPGLAVAARLRESGVDVHWIGSRAGIEARRVPEAGITFHTIPVGKLRRYWDWQNVPDLAVRAPAGLAQSWRLLRRLRPALLLATGGFVALPPALAARTLGIPLVIHEQTSVPGLANRVAGRFARRIALTFPLTGTEFPKERTVLTGNPLRQELLGGIAGGRPAPLRPGRVAADRVRDGRRAGRAPDQPGRGRSAASPARGLPGDPPVRRQREDRRSGLARRARPGAAGVAPPPLRPDRVRRRRAARRLRGGRARRRAQRRGHGQRVLPARPAPPSTSRCRAPAETSRQPTHASWRPREAPWSSRRSRSRLTGS